LDGIKNNSEVFVLLRFVMILKGYIDGAEFVTKKKNLSQKMKKFENNQKFFPNLEKYLLNLPFLFHVLERASPFL
jgi:hypothetical protein